MFDVSFTELLVIGVVALVVIGPERLPKVARTLGHLVGRAQRYVNDVKSDIQREVQLDELRNLKTQMQDAAQSVQSTLSNVESSFREPIQSLEQNTMSALKDSTNELDDTVAEATAPAVSASDSASAMAHVEAALPTPQPTQLEIDGVSAVQAPLPLEVPHNAPTATIAISSPGSKT